MEPSDSGVREARHRRQSHRLAPGRKHAQQSVPHRRRQLHPHHGHGRQRVPPPGRGHGPARARRATLRSATARSHANHEALDAHDRANGRRRSTSRPTRAQARAAGVPATRIYTIADIFSDPHYAARGSIVARPTGTRHGRDGRRGAAAVARRRARPHTPARVGEDTDACCGAARHGDGQSRARRSGVIACASRGDSARTEDARTMGKRKDPKPAAPETLAEREFERRRAARPSRWAGREARAAHGRRHARTRASGSTSCSTPAPSSNLGCSAHRLVRAERDRSPADGKIAGFGRIDGRDVAVVANDFTVMGASSAPPTAARSPT